MRRGHMYKGFIIVDVQMTTMVFIVVIRQWELVVDIIVVALVKIAVMRRRLWSSLLEGGGHRHHSQWQWSLG